MSAVIVPGIGASGNVVHEAEAQRQHARVKLPAKISLLLPRGEEAQAPLIDLSVGGFAFEPGKETFAQGQFGRGKLLFEVEGIGFALNVEFQVRYIQPGKRVGCQFHNVRPREMAALRYLISSMLSGDLVNVGDLIGILQRDNFVKPRKGRDEAPESWLARARAAGGSFAIFVVGLLALGYVLYQLYDVYFVTHADSAQVVVPGQQVSMPREGMVQSLVAVGATVAKGAPVASYSSTMLDVLRNILPESEMTPENLERLFGKSVQGTLTSPCDCRVVAQLVGDGQAAAKGAAVFALAPLDSVASVEARFPYRAFDKLQPGTPVNFLVGGETAARGGTIARMALQDGGLASDIRVVITPDEPLDSALATRPVDVRIQPLGGLLSLLATSRAAR